MSDASSKSDSAAADPRQPYLLVMAADSPFLVGRLFRLDKSPVVIGRGVTADVQLSEEGVSRRHAELREGDLDADLAPDEPPPRDIVLRARNGVLAVNGERVEKSRRLAHGDRVQIGKGTILRYVLQRASEARERERAWEAKVRDAETGLFNSRYFRGRLSSEVTSAAKADRQLSLMFIQLEDGKELRERLGELRFGELLREMGGRLADRLRSEDLLARTGSLHFAALLADADASGARLVGERLQQALFGAPFVGESGAAEVVKPRVSIGSATRKGDALAEGAEALMSAATAALREAVKLGRGAEDDPEAALYVDG